MKGVTEGGKVYYSDQIQFVVDCGPLSAGAINQPAGFELIYSFTVALDGVIPYFEIDPFTTTSQICQV